ncbi:TAXI family TRAP transporter solute-binding subunit [Corynebacterium aquatimens]|uniref:TAXI family TRAP transporter solute-binding subunit n=1 Tax=Corynebacterium TaxID=1716 RepID=UPI001F1CB3B2|nr:MULTISPECIES: TAXI family TRAP transporter solute-binding subunit [Corynebacterium]QYH19522.1 TAXI family TRAP transporter solute-binding subunit [Corynebacterium aquatimens]UIZ91534.1 TAXI family TRAP transporter solute-binding subunit [Corynebacterium sp. CNCTC7651]
MRTRAIAAVIVAGSLVLAGCSDSGNNTAAPSATNETKGTDSTAGSTDANIDFVTIATGGTSGPYYQIGATMSQILNRELGADSSVQATGASVENIQLLVDGNAEVAFAMGDATRQAIDGTGPFEGKGKVNELKAITALYPNYVQIVTTSKSGIKSVEDLRGKRVGVGDKNSGVELNAQMILDAHGMNYDDINEDFLSYSDAIDQMKNGQIDAAFVTSGLPNSSVMDLVTTEDVVVVPIEGAGMDALLKKYPFFDKSAIPGGTYDEAEDVPTAAITNQLLVSPSLSDDQVYAITKALFENLDEIHSAHNAAKGITLESVEDGLATELHPGARRYFEEVGAL